MEIWSLDVCKDTEPATSAVSSQLREDLSPKLQVLFIDLSPSEHSGVEKPFMEELEEEMECDSTYTEHTLFCSVVMPY